MTSTFPVHTLSQADVIRVEEARRSGNGQQPFVSFAEIHDDGTRLFPALTVEAGGATESLREKFATSALRNYQMALRRDAQHAFASRGRLNVLALQTRVVISFDVLNVASQAGL